MISVALLTLCHTLWQTAPIVEAKSYDPIPVINILNKEEAIQLKGKVIDYEKNTPLKGVAILQKGTHEVTVTNNEGSFHLTIEKGARLLFAYSGKHLYEVDTNNLQSNNLVVLLKEDCSPAESKGETKFNVKEDSESQDSIPFDDEDDEVFTVVEWMPEYPDGMAGLMKLIKENIKYPENAPKTKRIVSVIVQFIIHRDGRTSDFKVVNSPHPAFNEEAIRVLKLMKKWEPGMRNGEKVKVKYSMPVSFMLNR